MLKVRYFLLLEFWEFFILHRSLLLDTYFRKRLSLSVTYLLILLKEYFEGWRFLFYLFYFWGGGYFIFLCLIISVVSNSSWPDELFARLWTVAWQNPLSMGFFRQAYWSGLPCPPPGHFPHPQIESTSPAPPALQVDSLPLSHWGISLYM